MDASIPDKRGEKKGGPLPQQVTSGNDRLFSVKHERCVEVEAVRVLAPRPIKALMNKRYLTALPGLFWSFRIL
jgi:hypothetical protein